MNILCLLRRHDWQHTLKTNALGWSYCVLICRRCGRVDDRL